MKNVVPPKGKSQGSKNIVGLEVNKIFKEMIFVVNNAQCTANPDTKLRVAADLTSLQISLLTNQKN